MFLLSHKKARACAEKKTELIGHYRARKFCIYFPRFSPIHQNIKMWSLFCQDVPKDSHVVLWSKCLKTAEKSSQSVVAVFPHLINSARSYMTFLPHNVPQSIILIRLDVTSSFRKRLVSTNESSETNFRLFQVATKTGNEDEEKDRESW